MIPFSNDSPLFAQSGRKIGWDVARVPHARGGSACETSLLGRRRIKTNFLVFYIPQGPDRFGFAHVPAYFGGESA